MQTKKLFSDWKIVHLWAYDNFRKGKYTLRLQTYLIVKHSCNDAFNKDASEETIVRIEKYNEWHFKIKETLI